jgi:translation initiation factor 2 subunit 3
MDINISEIMENQPIINIGMIGHVSNGKSTLTRELSGKNTLQFSSEKKSGKTIHLGYANTKIWKCMKCNKPECYSSSDSDVMSKRCQICNELSELVNHISIVDCPGHHMLTATMLNGASVMDYTILVESFVNDKIPAPQTKEHLIATKTSNIDTSMIIMNKIDTVKKNKAYEKIEKIENFYKKYYNNVPPIVPISATFGSNIDVVCEYISNLRVPITNDYNGKFKMIVIRSFDINKPGTNVIKLNGGVIGGTIMRGNLKVNDKINIYPGIVRRLTKEEKVSKDNDFKYKPLTAIVLSIQSEKNKLETAISGGLLAIQLTIDPSFTRDDHLSGSLVYKANDKNKYKVYDKIIVKVNNFILNKEKAIELLKNTKLLEININSNNVSCKVLKYSKSKNELRLILNKPICVDEMNIITISSKGKTKTIIGCGNIIDGIECEKI